MKKVRIVFSVAALMFAIGGVFASNLIASEQGYIRNPTTGVCDQDMICSGSGPVCENEDGQELYRKEINGTCVTNVLQHTP